MEATWDATAVWRMDEASLWHAGDQAQQLRQAAYVRMVETVAELWNRTGRSKEDRVSLVAQLQKRWRLTKRDALQIVDHAELFASDAVRDAARAGELDADRLTVMRNTLAAAPILERERVEAELLDHSHLHLQGFRMAAKRIQVLLDQDGPEPKYDLAQPKREFHYSRRADGSVGIRGIVDTETGVLLDAMMDPLAKPEPGDTRTTAQRQGDAFAEIIELAASSDKLPAQGGERPHVAITIAVQDFITLEGTGQTDDGEPIPAESVRRIACDSVAMRAIMGATSAPMNIGRKTRIVPNSIRKALIIRDKG